MEGCGRDRQTHGTQAQRHGMLGIPLEHKNQNNDDNQPRIHLLVYVLALLR